MKSGDRGWVVQWFKFGDPMSGAKESSGAVFFESREAADKYVAEKRAEKHAIVPEPMMVTVEMNAAAAAQQARAVAKVLA